MIITVRELGELGQVRRDKEINNIVERAIHLYKNGRGIASLHDAIGAVMFNFKLTQIPADVMEVERVAVKMLQQEEVESDGKYPQFVRRNA